MEISREYAWKQTYDHVYERFYEYLSPSGHKWLARRTWEIERQYKLANHEVYTTEEKLNDIRILYRTTAENLATKIANRIWKEETK